MKLMSEKECDQEINRILVVDLEPTPYKIDLWNIFSASKNTELFVIYTEKKNWSPDGGHNYLKLPESRHESTVLEGKGIYGALRSALFVARKIFRSKAGLIYIAGYVGFATISAIVCSIILRRGFVVHADEFNNGRPQGKFGLLKWFLREILRKLVFKYGEAVLVCGRRGIETALMAGCKEEKILDFPYVIDVERMRMENPEAVPEACVGDLEKSVTTIFFSGRMIPRKGLQTLLAAFSGKAISKEWVLWVEGDGPELNRYKALAQEHGIQDHCRFLGFCQHDVHSWLIRSADIVVVPSLVDTWGIVVDEGIQLGKVVISSDATGSGYDRILNGSNGFIFPAGDSASLSNILIGLIDGENQGGQIGSLAMAGAKRVRPEDNLETLLKLIKTRHEKRTSRFWVAS